MKYKYLVIQVVYNINDIINTEYQMLNTSNSFNEYAKAGWELVTVNQNYAYFKKLIKE